MGGKSTSSFPAGGSSARAAITGIGAGFGAGSAYADTQKEVNDSFFKVFLHKKQWSVCQVWVTDNS